MIHSIEIILGDGRTLGLRVENDGADRALAVLHQALPDAIER